jgi:ectoine hydroxylase-related dioxygenase (phytanoyl-CoA dioxygenase family)
MVESSCRLSPEQTSFYEDNGFLFPIRVLSDAETTQMRSQFDAYTRENQNKLSGMIPRERRAVYSLTHLELPWVYELVSHPHVLDAVEEVIGPNILVWESAWFIKFPRDKAFISWHQDGAYWGLHPPNVTTAWVALSDSVPENGCMQVLPGTHKAVFPQRDTYAKYNALSRGQEISVTVDEAKAVNMILRPGEMSLHHIGVVHGSKANTSDAARIGIAIRYIAPEVVQDGPQQQIVHLVRGKDKHGHFKIIDPPKDGLNSAEIRREAQKRILKNILPEDSAKK